MYADKEYKNGESVNTIDGIGKIIDITVMCHCRSKRVNSVDTNNHRAIALIELNESKEDKWYRVIQLSRMQAN